MARVIPDDINEPETLSLRVRLGPEWGMECGLIIVSHTQNDIHIGTPLVCMAMFCPLVQ